MSHPYRSRVEKLAATGSHEMQNLQKLLSKNLKTSSTKVVYLHRELKPPAPKSLRYENLSPLELVKRVEVDLDGQPTILPKTSIGVCIIENISPDYIETLGIAWNIDPEFFARYASTPSPDHLWDHRDEEDSYTISGAGSQPTKQRYRHLYGIFEYHGLLWSLDKMKAVASANHFCDRHLYQEARGTIVSSTTFSYCRASPFLYLFLVDPPLATNFKSPSQPNKLQHRQWHQLLRVTVEDSAVSLRFPYTGNKGGLWTPPVLFGDDSLFNRLDKVLCRHPWHLEVICTRPEVFPAVPFLYLLTCSLTETIMVELDAQIKHASFIEIRRPSWDMTDRLHEFRQQLSTLQAALKETQSNEPDVVEEYFRTTVGKDNAESLNFRLRNTPKERILALLNDVAELRASILETFDLLISTIAVLDSKESKRQTEESLKQTRQSILLTSLATVYLPLSLATGVFGMNLLELAGSGPRVWVFVVTALALILATVLVFGILWRGNATPQSARRLKVWQRRRSNARRSNVDDDEKM